MQYGHALNADAESTNALQADEACRVERAGDIQGSARRALNQASELLQQMGGHDKPAADMSADDASKLFAPEPAASAASAPADDGDAVRRALEEAAKK